LHRYCNAHFHLQSAPLDSSTALLCPTCRLTTMHLSFLNFQVTQVEYFWRSSSHRQTAGAQTLCLRTPCMCCVFSNEADNRNKFPLALEGALCNQHDSSVTVEVWAAGLPKQVPYYSHMRVSVYSEDGERANSLLVAT
jgi:hypothetical protein